MSNPHPLRFFLLLVYVLLSISLTACGGGGSGDDTAGESVQVDQIDPVTQSAHKLQQIIISPFVESVAKGGQIHFTSTGIYDDQSSTDLSAEVIWSVSDETLASIDGNGNVLPLKAGVVNVQASVAGLEAERSLTIKDVNLDSIKIVPSSVELASGFQQTFQAIGHYSDGSSQDITQQVSWSSTNPQIAQLTSSLAYTQSVGETAISALLDGVSGHASMTVNDALLQRIEINPMYPQLQVGLASPVSLQGVFSDHTVRDITGLATWQVNNSAVISMDVLNFEIQALSAGTAVLSAEVDGFQADYTLQVNQAVLDRIEISPLNTDIAAGGQQEFHATGVYSNGTAQDLTGQVTWVSSNETVAVIDNRLRAKGEMTALSAGSVVISAYFAGQSASTTISISDAGLVAIDVTPANSSIAVGLTQQFEAIALYSDGSKRLVTDQVEWSSDSQVATQVGSHEPGLFQANHQGDTLLFAGLENKQGYTRFEVTDATLLNLNLVAASVKLVSGTTQQLRVYAQYSDGSTQDVTDQVSWSSSAPSVIRVSNGSGSKGMVSALTPGNTIITTRLDSAASSLSLESTAATLQQIELTSSVVGSLYVNQQLTLDVVGIYSDGSQQSLNQLVNWHSSANQVASVSHANDSLGVVTALSAGSTSLTASYAGIYSNSLNLEVMDNPNLAASISIVATPNVIFNDGSDTTTLLVKVKPLQAQGVIADGTEVDFIIVEDGNSRIEYSTTVDGMASITLSSVFKGIIEISAEVADTEINASTAVYSTDNFANVLQVVPVSRAVLIDNKTAYQQGSLFAIFMRNLSNRDFNIDALLVRNGGVNFPGTPITDAIYLSDGVLEGGEYTGAGYQLDENTIDHTISMGYVLSDTPVQRYFGFSVGFNSP